MKTLPGLQSSHRMQVGFIRVGFVAIWLAWAGAGRGDETEKAVPTAGPGDPLPATELLTWDDPLDVRMMRDAHQFVERKIQAAVDVKGSFWKHDFSSPAAYDQSIEKNRDRLRFLLGVDDPRRHINTHLAFDATSVRTRMERVGDDSVPAILYECPDFRIARVRWPALPGVFGEGLLLEPVQPFQASVVVVPDADQTPEQLVGLTPGVPAKRQIARRLAASGVRVLIPTLINRHDLAGKAQLNQSNREWIYRQAFHMGRHIIGYEIDKIVAAINWFETTNPHDQPIGLSGWGEGALLALYTAALDRRIDATLISGDWASRDANWREPIYRNVWSLMKEFDDTDLAMMIAPRTLIVEQSLFPKIDQQRDKAMLHESENSVSTSATVLQAGNRLAELREAAAEASGNREPDEWESWLQLMPSEGRSSSPYAESAQLAFAKALGVELGSLGEAAIQPMADVLDEFAIERHQRQVAEMDDYTQQLVRDSAVVREAFYLQQALPELSQRKWSTAAVHDITPVDSFTKHSAKYRRIFAEDVLGTFDEPLLPPNPRSRQIQQTERWVAHEVVLDVVPGLFAWGILMQPNDLQPAQVRPVVVVQHGRNGLPVNVMNGGYNGIAEKLLGRGYIVFAPHNLYRGEDEYRWLDRKANAIGKTLFSFLLLQHDQITRWLAELPQVDGDRIGFYGNSYGGESAVRIPTVLTKYALSICASDFNDWTRKVADTHDTHSFMRTIEWEMPYFNMGQTFSYAEMAYLMVPRPFMVERGHHDLVAPDSWVASEYAKVRLVYDQLGISDRTAITFFQGGHTMRGEATLQFLKQHLGR